MHLQIVNFLQIWILSQNIGRSVIFNLKKIIEEDYILAEKSQFHVYAGSKSLPLD